MFLEKVVEYSPLEKPEIGDFLEKYTFFSLGMPEIIEAFATRNPKIPQTCWVNGQILEIFEKNHFHIWDFIGARPLAIVIIQKDAASKAKISSVRDVRFKCGKKRKEEEKTRNKSYSEKNSLSGGQKFK